MDGATIYTDTRARLLALGPSLDADDAATPVPALPGWTVRDTYAHLTGVPSDVLNGRMDGAGGDAWTARQLDARRGASLSEVCGEWEGDAPAFDAWLGEADQRGIFCVFDAWAHCQDIRGALGEPRPEPAGGADEATAFLLANALEVFDHRFRGAGTPALALVTDTAARTIGDGDPGARLRTDDYSLMRILFGRRSRAQILAADWDGDAEPYLEQLHLFDLPVGDLVD